VKQTQVLIIAVLIDAWYIQMSLINSGVTGPMHTKFLHNVGKSLLLLICPSALRYSNLFRNASVMNEGG